MRYSCGWSFAVVCLVCCFTVTATAQSGLTVTESAAHIELTAVGVRVELPIVNPFQENLSADVSIELMSPKGEVDSWLDRRTTFPPGKTRFQAVLPPISGKKELDAEALAWYRLVYSITFKAPDLVAGKPVTGTISVSEIAPSLFGLHVAAPVYVKPGSSGTLLVRAVHPVTLRPIQNVSVQASLDINSDDGKPILTNEVATNSRGFASLRYSLPKNLDEDHIDVTVKGVLGNLTATAEKEILANHFPEISISTDKFLYQPGQTVHVRAIYFDPDKKSVAEATLAAHVYDPENTLVYSASAKTSRFGVAAMDWAIPGNLRLGTYSIRVCDKESDSPEECFPTDVKVSRYDLPNFAVRAKPDRAYYLPGQNAEVEVAADYLFGEPVIHGHVRVVRETERSWNFREQKWATKADATYEGDTDSQGRYVAHIDLGSELNDLSGDDYERFRDLAFTASFTDSTTGKTEEKRFDVRITKEPIHVYALGLDRDQSKGMPFEFYISTDYADGTPAQCDVDIDWPGTSSPWRESSVPLPPARFLRRVRTNRYGVAKVAGLNLPGGGEITDFDLSFRARDRKGATGNHTESVMLRDTPGIFVRTDKTLYSPGEPIGIELTTAAPATTLVVQAGHESEVVTRQLVHLRHGHAFLVIPPSDQFRNEVSISAYLLGGRDDNIYSGVVGYRNVYFPRPQGLDIDVRMSKSAYKPGEEASALLQVTGSNRTQNQSALGLVVVDRAVEEREASDRERGERGGFYGFRGGDEWGTELQGVRLSDLDKLDLTKPLPSGLELVAEAMLRTSGFGPDVFKSNDDEDVSTLFKLPLLYVLGPVRTELDNRYKLNGQYPADLPGLNSQLAEAGIRADELLDPWGTPFRASFRVRNEMDVLELTSAGLDKTFGTDDDFSALEMSWPYFKPIADAIQRAVDEFHVRTGGFLRDEKSLQGELARLGIDLASLRDRWGHPYRFDFVVRQTRYAITVTSAGPDGRFGTERAPSDDDFTLSTATIDYFQEIQTRIDTALTEAYNRDHVFPETLEQLKQVLAKSGFNWDDLRDPWGHPYYATFRQEAMYADDFRVQAYESYVNGAKQRTTITPVTRHMNFLYLRSAGEDGVEGTSDDFEVATFSRYLFQSSAASPYIVGTPGSTVLAGAMGAISGKVIDPSGGVIFGATVEIRLGDSGQPISATTDEEGKYILRNVPAGNYDVNFWARGFRSTKITGVPVRSSSITAIDVVLNVGATNQTVTVSESAPLVETSNATLAGGGRGQTASTSISQPTFTPRLREYFPETLFWQPELVTDKNGRAQIRVPLADNITTWKLSVIASNESGEIGTADKEIRAFQPFFAEHDPPRFLTVGDQIDLPVVLRNYLDHDLQITTALKPESWFTPLGPPSVKTTVPRRDSAPAIFKFRAAEAIKEGKQRVTATSADAGDAVERKVTVHPDGEDRTVTTSQVVGDSSRLQIEIPEEAIAGSLEGTLKIYPNLQAHLLESIEEITERPYGCAEQIISSSYPSLLLLRYAQGNSGAPAPMIARAKRNLQFGYQRLLSDINEDGGVTYWGRGEADAALTAYAMKFLSDAREFVDVDDSAAEKPVRWLLHSAPHENGRWIARNWNGTENPRRSLLLTAYIAQTIASTNVPVADAQRDSLLVEAKAAVQKALAYLDPEVGQVDEPYVLASYGLAAAATGDKARVTESVNRLLAMERREGDSSYWSIETNTPFYGWGLAGRIETTALVLELLAKSGETSTAVSELESRGLLFLLRKQDRFGIWYSTQATVKALDAIGSLTSSPAAAASGTSAASAQKAAILVDGRQVLSVDLPAPDGLAAPVFVDVSKFLPSGSHILEIDRGAGAPKASAQLVASYYVPWTRGAETSELQRLEKSSEALRLSVQFDEPAAAIGDRVVCSVDAERVGFRGYGMMLAEIGLPPGADVDRSSLDKAIAEAGWNINSYDVLPDRLIVYLWPRAGGTKFSFTFKPRFGLRAQTAPSVLYDYYNPEARAVVAPTSFVVR